MSPQFFPGEFLVAPGGAHTTTAYIYTKNDYTMEREALLAQSGLAINAPIHNVYKFD